jgi:cyclase
MIKAILFVFALLLTKAAFSQTQNVRELAPGVYFYLGDELQGKSANCLWIIFSDYVLVIDANYPWGSKEIMEEIRKTTNRPVKFVFNTHYHHDHSFGNCVFVDSGASIVSTKETAAEMRTLGQLEWDQNYSGRNLKQYRREFPSLTFDQHLVFEDSSHYVELIKMGPAHTLGDGVAWLPNERILVTGDLFVNGNPWGNNVADPNANYDRWLAVLDTLATWDPKTIVPGHGELATIETLKNQRDYLADMLQQVRQGLKDGKSKEDLVKTINLSRYPGYGKNKVSTERSIRAMYDKLTRK